MISIAGNKLCGFSVIKGSYTTPFEFVSGIDRTSYIVVDGLAGHSVFHRGLKSFRSDRGQGGILSASGEIRMTGSRQLQLSEVSLDVGVLTRYCEAWIGSQLEEPLVFEHANMAPVLLQHWKQTVSSIRSIMQMEWCPQGVIDGLIEHAMSLLITLHPHNHSRHIAAKGQIGRSRVREAKWLLEHSRQAMTAGRLADAINVPIPQLVAGFSRHEGEGRLDALIRKTWESPLHYWSHPNAGDISSPRRPGKHGVSPKKRELKASVASEIEEHVSLNLASEVFIADLAKIAGLSTHRFIETFKMTFGVTPAQYIIQARTERAKELLEKTTLGIATIAAETGFSSHSHFSEQFSRRVGQTPSEYRVWVCRNEEVSPPGKK